MHCSRSKNQRINQVNVESITTSLGTDFNSQSVIPHIRSDLKIEFYTSNRMRLAHCDAVISSFINKDRFRGKRDRRLSEICEDS